MFLENRDSNRTNWKYEYTGAELLEPARKLYTQLKTKEVNLRQQMSSLMSDMSANVTGKGTDDLKKDLERTAILAEECTVWMHEFEQRPNSTYLLTQGDVVFFNYPKKANAPKPLAPQPDAAVFEPTPIKTAPQYIERDELEGQIVSLMKDRVARDAATIIKAMAEIYKDTPFLNISHTDVKNLLLKMIGTGHLITTVDQRYQYKGL